jgi:hypothetical protein
MPHVGITINLHGRISGHVRVGDPPSPIARVGAAESGSVLRTHGLCDAIKTDGFNACGSVMNFEIESRQSE